jgi:hypothetical protein
LWWDKVALGRFSPSSSVSPAIVVRSTNYSTITLMYHRGKMYNRPICGRSAGAYTNLGDLERDLMGVKSHPTKKNSCPVVNVGYFRRGYSDRHVKLTIHLHLVPRLRMCRVVSVSPTQFYTRRGKALGKPHFCLLKILSSVTSFGAGDSVVGWGTILQAGNRGFESRWGDWIFQFT